MVISNAKRVRQQPVEDETTAVLTPAVFHILLALSDGNSHGYRIMQDVESRSGKPFDLPISWTSPGVAICSPNGCRESALITSKRWAARRKLDKG